MIDFPSLVAHLGPAAVFLGAGFEGHTAVIAGGVLAHQDLMPLWVAYASAWAGSWAVDQGLFLLGRRGRDTGFVQRAIAVPAFDKALRFIEHYPVGYTLVFRFLYGLRMVSPVAIGVSKVSAQRFFVLNVIGAAIWAGVFTAIGYLFGHALEGWFSAHHLTQDQWLWLGAAVAAVIAATYLVRRIAR